MPKYIDAHCHTETVPTVGAIVNAAQITDWGRVTDLAVDGVFGAVGVHPWYISGLPTDWLIKLRDVLVTNPCLHVGEIGLDKYKPNMELQISVFKGQLLLAHELGRGVSLHCVGAWERIAHILKMSQNKLPQFILAHGYNGPINQIQKFADSYNMYFSYGPREIANPARILETPRNRILAETDSTDPSNIVDVVNAIADILSVDRTEMADIIYDNTIRMLNHG